MRRKPCTAFMPQLPKQFISPPAWCAFAFSILPVAGFVGAAAGIGGAFGHFAGSLAAFPAWEITVAQGAHVGYFFAVFVHGYFLSLPARWPDCDAEAFGLVAGVGGDFVRHNQNGMSSPTFAGLVVKEFLSSYNQSDGAAPYWSINRGNSSSMRRMRFCRFCAV